MRGEHTSKNFTYINIFKPSNGPTGLVLITSFFIIKLISQMRKPRKREEK